MGSLFWDRSPSTTIAPLSEQQHRIGPVVYFPGTAEESYEIGLGVLVGLTDETADYTFKWNLSVGF